MAIDRIRLAEKLLACETQLNFISIREAVATAAEHGLHVASLDALEAALHAPIHAFLDSRVDDLVDLVVILIFAIRESSAFTGDDGRAAIGIGLCLLAGNGQAWASLPGVVEEGVQIVVKTCWQASAMELWLRGRMLPMDDI